MFSITEYKQNVKEFRLEEPFDYFVFRPLAYILVKLTYFLPLTPNLFSLFALVVALFSGFALAQGTTNGFVLGGVGIILFSIFDCCDGMLARMKQNSSKFGELIDMLVDALSNIAFYVGLFIGVLNSNSLELIAGDFVLNSTLLSGNFSFAFVCLLSGFMILLHASIYNFYKKQLYYYDLNQPNGRSDEIEAYRKEYLQIKNQKGMFLEKTLLRLFLLFSKTQNASSELVQFDANQYPLVNRRILPLWALMAGSTHQAILAAALIFARVDIYCLYAVVIANVWLLIVSLLQNNVNSSIRLAQ